MKRFIILLILFVAVSAHGATYNYYFSDDAAGNAAGDNTTGDGTIENPWKTLQKAEDVMKVLADTDVVNLYFDRGDTWNFATNVVENFSVETGDPVVHIKAYGSGDRPVFQGDISDFSAADDDGDNSYNRWNRVFQIEVDDCSIDNIEIKDAYGDAITLEGIDGFTLSNSVIHNVGYSFLKADDSAQNITAEHNILYDGQLLHLNSKLLSDFWGNGISFFNQGGGPYSGNTIQYNLIYNVGGEAISAVNSTIQYNVIGNSSSIALDLSTANWDAGTTIARHNFIVMSDWSSGSGLAHETVGGPPDGIRVFDESNCTSVPCTGPTGGSGDNSGADIQIYGNVIINRGYGIRVYSNDDTGNPFGAVKIYNNLVIDSHWANILIADPEEFTNLYLYNNIFVFYDNGGDNVPHTTSFTPEAGWDISNNLFYAASGSHTVDSDFDTGKVTTDPTLPGNAALDFGALASVAYAGGVVSVPVNYSTQLYPVAGDTIAGGITPTEFSPETEFLTTGVDFNYVLSWPSLVEIDTAYQGTWDIGPWARGTSEPVPTYPIQGAAGNFKYN